VIVQTEKDLSDSNFLINDLNDRLDEDEAQLSAQVSGAIQACKQTYTHMHTHTYTHTHIRTHAHTNTRSHKHTRTHTYTHTTHIHKTHRHSFPKLGGRQVKTPAL